MKIRSAGIPVVLGTHHRKSKKDKKVTDAAPRAISERTYALGDRYRINQINS